MADHIQARKPMGRSAPAPTREPGSKSDPNRPIHGWRWRALERRRRHATVGGSLMRTRPVTLVLLALMITVAAMALIACSRMGLQDSPPGLNQIHVVLTCSTNQGAGIRVNPYRRDLDPGDIVTWRGVGSYKGAFTIEPYGHFPWSLDPPGGTSSDGDVTGTPPAGGVLEGEYRYLVRFTCNGEEVVLDPRMEVPRG